MKSLGYEISIMTFSTIISQLLVIISAFVLGKMLGPEVFGIYGKIFAIAILFSMYLSFKVELAIFDSNDREKLIRMIDSLKVLLINSFCSFLLVLFFYLVFENQSYLFYGFFLGISINLFGIISTLYVSQAKFFEISIIRILQAFFALILQITLASIFQDIGMIVIGLMFSYIVFATPIAFKELKGAAEEIKIYTKKYSKILVDQKRFVLYTTPAEFIASSAGFIPLLFIETSFGAFFLGLFVMTIRILNVPISFISKSIGEVFRGNLSQNRENPVGLINLFYKISLMLLLMSISLILAIYIIPESLYLYFLGSDWAGIKNILSILVFLYAFKLIASTLSFALIFFEKQHIALLWQVFMLSFSILPFLISEDINFALTIYTALGSLAYVVLYIYSLYLFRMRLFFFKKE